MTVMIIGVDPAQELAHRDGDAGGDEHGGGFAVCRRVVGRPSELLRWAAQFPQRRWAIENAKGLGRHLAQWLVARGEPVLDVPTPSTSRVRELSRGGGRRNDVTDASAAGSVAAFAWRRDGHSCRGLHEVFALLEERRANVASQRARVVNQLHALLRDLVPGGAPTALSAAVAAAMLRTVRPAGERERTRKELARDLAREVRALDASLGDIEKRMAAALAAHQSRLLEVDGVGPVLGVRLIGRTGRESRFRSDAAYASYSGTAPIEVASGERQRHRLSRSGDRQLNSALHLVAVTQVRMTNSDGRRYFDRKIADGKTRNEGGSVLGCR